MLTSRDYRPNALIPITLLILLLPFEPRHPLARAFGLELSFLELAAALLLGTTALLLATGRGRLVPARLPLGGFALAFLVVCFVSSYWAESPRWLPLKFTLRVTAGVTACVLTSAALAAVPRPSLLFAAYASAGLVTSFLAFGEVGQPDLIGDIVAPFREHGFEVGGRPRAAATFGYPNSAAGFLVLSLPAALYFLCRPDSSRRLRWGAAGASLAIFAAILLTYSRGGLLGAFAGTSLLGLWLRWRRSPAAGSVLAVTAGFLATTAALGLLDPSFKWRAMTEDDSSWYRAEIEPGQRSLRLDPGQVTQTDVLVRNTGSLHWGASARRPFHLSYRLFTAAPAGALDPIPFEGERTRLAAAVAPGESVELLAGVTAPLETGEYFLLWDVVHENTTWFSDKGALGLPVSVQVGDVVGATRPDPIVIQAWVAARAWRPGRSELWSLALGMFRENPLLGVGPDNFRWLYGRDAGRSTWDTRLYSNSLYLEILATTGLLGAAAFAGLLLRALRGLQLSVAKALNPTEALTVLAAVVGFLVHGVFDYLLEFTPIYLAFWIMLGIASALIREEAIP